MNWSYVLILSAGLIKRFDKPTFEAINDRFNKCAQSLDRIEYLKTRKTLFSSLKRKYGSSTKEILERFNLIKEQIDILSDYEYNIERQMKVIEEKEKEAYDKAKILSDFRKNQHIFRLSRR